jgi:NAD(P)-dependent dehydrogenase (short-subunit alcohol dehydrogenase family)
VPARLAGKVAVVTGSGSGIGRSAAELFAAEGASVAVADLSVGAAEETTGRIQARGGTAIALQADVTSAADLTMMVATTVAEFGRLDILYNNAGIGVGGSVLDASEDDWDRCFAVNVKSVYLAARAAVPQMAAGGGGSIINTASVAALVAIENAAAYCAAKAAVIGLTRNMAIDLAPLGIRVNVICPGTVLTPLAEQLIIARGGGDRAKGMAQTVAKYPIGRLGEEIAHVALFLACDDSSFVTGASFTADGGMTAQ